MKVHRNILFISLLISIISLIFVINISTEEKLFQIALAFMGSSFISFMLEVPNYISLKQNNADKLYNSLFELKCNLNFFKNSIENELDNYAIITDKFYEPFNTGIQLSLNSTKSFDQNFYFSKKKSKLVAKSFNNFNNAYNNLSQSFSLYGMAFYRKKINILETEKIDRSIAPSEMVNELMIIIKNCNTFLQIIEDEIPIVLSKKKLNNWIVDNASILNNNENFKISQKDKYSNNG